MTKVGRVVLVAIAAIGLSACGAQTDGNDPPAAPGETPASQTSPSAPLSGDAILIETQITDARSHEAEVLDGSVIGESAFCPGGKAKGASEGPTITTTFTCSAGTLTVQYAPMQRSLVQSATWEVVSGTGDFEGLRGGGSMVAAFESDDPDSGQETFTGTVSR